MLLIWIKYCPCYAQITFVSIFTAKKCSWTEKKLFEVLKSQFIAILTLSGNWWCGCMVLPIDHRWLPSSHWLKKLLSTQNPFSWSGTVQSRTSRQCNSNLNNTDSRKTNIADPKAFHLLHIEHSFSAVSVRHVHCLLCSHNKLSRHIYIHKYICMLCHL